MPDETGARIAFRSGRPRLTKQGRLGITDVYSA
jgi:hypothetical protein